MYKLKYTKLPLYLPYKPYEYTVDYDYKPGIRPTGAKYFRKRLVYRPVENMDFSVKNKHYLFVSGQSAAKNRENWNKYKGDIYVDADNRGDMMYGYKRIGAIASWMNKYKSGTLKRFIGPRQYKNMPVRKIHRPINRKRCIEVIDLT